ncbi:MAG: GTP-binding protein [Polaromonas sp.]|nr:GTP-binding protein [Polaromonas sp.]
MNETPVQIQFALISHTNNGKTTLARTLLGADVGEVRDAAHVTLLSESHALLTTAQGDSLQLWDTPGFGDSVRLLKRLGMADNPIGWFLREVFDRLRDRPFWLSQQALRTARDAADVVLYLVNSAENPLDAGYLAAEMKILEWLGKPVVVLLNQMGPPRPAQQEQAELSRWSSHLAGYPAVRQVLALDAFARCWVHERVFYEAVGKLIDGSKAEAYARLLAVWEANNQTRFHEAMRLAALQLVAAVRDRQAVEPENKTLVNSALKAVGLRKSGNAPGQEQAMEKLIGRLNLGIARATRDLLALHRLDPGEAAKINKRVRENFAIRAPIDKAQAGLLGALLSGVATGLSADLMTGGLTLGAGALLGGVVGALGFAGAAWGFNATTDRNQATVAFTDAFLRTFLVASVLRYLTVAHFGRGRGNFAESEAPAFWQTEVESAVAAHEIEVESLWQTLRNPSATDTDAAVESAQAVLVAVTSSTLDGLYPGFSSKKHSS